MGWVKTGSFITPASGTTVIDITTHGNDAKGIHLWGNYSTSNDTNEAGSMTWHGFAAGSLDYAGMTNSESNNTINTRRENVNNRCIFITDPANDATIDVAGTAVLNANDVTISYNNFTAGHVVHYEIFGGSDVSAVVREFAANTSPHTGVGFTSDLILFWCTGNAVPGNSQHAFMSFGCAHDNGASIDQWTLFSYQGDNDLDSIGSALAPAFNAGQYDVDYTAWQTTITAIGSDGFTWTGSNTDEIVALCIDFGTLGVDVGTFTKSTSTSVPVTQALPDLGFTPQFYHLSTSSETATSLNVNRDARISHGAYDEVSGAGHSCIATRDNSTGTDAHSRSNSAEVLQHSQNLNGSGVQSSATPQAITDSTPDIEWNPNTSAAEHIGYYAIEEEASGGAPGAIHQHMMNIGAY